MELQDFFVDVSALPHSLPGFIQLLSILLCYGYILMHASKLISNGSEFLLMVPAWSGLIGSIVLPVLGQVPDGCIVLFSGIGPNAQSQLDVGVGALAGSTIMLLTIPWFLSVLGGRVSINHGKLNYQGPVKLYPHSIWSSLRHTGVDISRYVYGGAFFMIGTASTYLYLQVPGIIDDKHTLTDVAHFEKYWALGGFAQSLALFICYLVYQFSISHEVASAQTERRDEVVQRSINEGSVSLLGALALEYARRDRLESSKVGKRPSKKLTESVRLIPTDDLKYQRLAVSIL